MGPEWPPLSVVDLTYHRGGRQLFNKLSFEVHNTEVLELRGPNGSGKSSLLRVLAGLDEPSDGKVLVLEGLHYVGHLDAIKPALTVAENLHFWADVLEDGVDIDEALDAFSLRPLADDPASILSQGQKRRLALSRLLLAKRAVWLLDEPTVGLDQNSLGQLRGVVASHLKTGGAVVAATHVELGYGLTKTLELGPLV